VSRVKLVAQNIISRVTGGSVSNIDGLIKANGTANLFLINPSGIIFGPNASLNIGGSFTASTASSINFPDGVKFSATAPQTTPLLTINIPSGLQFGVNPGKIQNQSHATDSSGQIVGLQVQPGKTLAIVGGDIELTGGNLSVPGGRIELGSVAGPAFVNMSPANNGWVFDYSGVQNFGNINLSQLSGINVFGKGGGDIQIYGGEVSILDGSWIKSINLGSETGGTILINAKNSFTLSGTGNFVSEELGIIQGTISPFDLKNGIFGITTNFGAGANIIINASSFTAYNGGIAAAIPYGSGQGGSVTVNSDSFSLSRAGVGALTNSAGNAGNLTINTKRFVARDNGIVTTSTSGKGHGGDLTVNASVSIELYGGVPLPVVVNGFNIVNTGIVSSTLGLGDAGDLHINTGKFIAQGGAQVGANTFGPGQGGNVFLSANFIQISGTSLPNSYQVAATSTDFSRLVGILPDGSIGTDLGANALGEGTGNSGSLNIKTGRLIVQGGADIGATTLGQNRAGSIAIEATKSVDLTDNAFIEARSSGQAQAGNIDIRGNIDIKAANISIKNGSAITAETASKEGGNINLNVPGLLILQRSSTINANARGTANGGNLNIKTAVLTALDNSNIRANAFKGQGGKIEISASSILRSQDSAFTASSSFGLSNVVQFNTQAATNFARAAINPVALPQIPVFTSVCSGRSTPSSLVNTGTGGSPSTADDPLDTSSTWHDDSLDTSSTRRDNSPVQGTQRITSMKQFKRLPGWDIPVTGWIVHKDGSVNFTWDAQATPGFSSLSCSDALSEKLGNMRGELTAPGFRHGK